MNIDDAGIPCENNEKPTHRFGDFMVPDDRHIKFDVREIDPFPARFNSNSWHKREEVETRVREIL